MRRAGLGCSVVLVALLGGCRVLPATDYWIEAQGNASVTAIAASPRGVDAIGAGQDVLHYPGDFGIPWKLLQHAAVRALAASPRFTYALEEKGFVSVVAGTDRMRRLKASDTWQVTALAADEHDQLYVVADGHAFRVEGKELLPLGCNGAVKSLAAGGGHVYVVSPQGALFVAADGGCQPMTTPGAVGSVSAFEKRLACVVKGQVHERVQGRWRRLPQPLRYRATGNTTVNVLEVSMSGNSIWVRDTQGYVYVLSEES